MADPATVLLDGKAIRDLLEADTSTDAFAFIILFESGAMQLLGGPTGGRDRFAGRTLLGSATAAQTSRASALLAIKKSSRNVYDVPFSRDGPECSLCSLLMTDGNVVFMLSTCLGRNLFGKRITRLAQLNGDKPKRVAALA